MVLCKTVCDDEALSLNKRTRNRLRGLIKREWLEVVLLIIDQLTEIFLQAAQGHRGLDERPWLITIGVYSDDVHILISSSDLLNTKDRRGDYWNFFKNFQESFPKFRAHLCSIHRLQSLRLPTTVSATMANSSFRFRTIRIGNLDKPTHKTPVKTFWPFSFTDRPTALQSPSP